MTEPTVLRGREISTVWLGLSGACTWSGAAGAKPKLKRDRSPAGVVGSVGRGDGHSFFIKSAFPKLMTNPAVLTM